MASVASTPAYYKNGAPYNIYNEPIIVITNGPTPPTGTVPSSPPANGGLYVSVLPFSVTPVHLQGRYNVEYIPGQGPKYTYYSELTQLQKMFDDQIAAAKKLIVEPVTQIIARAIASLQGMINTQTGDDSRVSSAGNLLDAAIKGLQDANNDLQLSENLVTQKYDAAERALKEAIPKLGLTNVSPADYDLLLTKYMDPISRRYWEEYSVKPRVEEFNAKQRLLASLDNIAIIINDVVSKSNTLTTIINQVKSEREAKAVAEAIAKAEAEARVKLAALMLVAGVNPTPVYTSEMVKSAQSALTAAGRMILNRASGMLQLSTIAEGILTTTSEGAGSIAGALWRGAIELSRIATVSTVGSTVGALVVGFWPTKAGEGSDRVPGRDIEMFAAQAQLFAAGKVNIQPEMTSVNLPVRGLLVTENGRQYVSLVKTGINGVSANVPVLRAVRDEKTGLDKITLPAVGGVPARTILVNPVPTGPTAPPHTGNSSPVPVTPVHTGTEIKQVASIVTTPYPADYLKDIRDFIYWQPDAAGTGVEPIYVMLSDPRNLPGKVTGKGQPVGEGWLNNAGKELGAPIPSQIADKLRGREFNNFREFREAFWLEVAKDPELAKQFNPGNKWAMGNGYAPYPIPSEQVGGREKFELHHVKLISEDGPVYDVDNLRILTPKRHIEIHSNSSEK